MKEYFYFVDEIDSKRGISTLIQSLDAPRLLSEDLAQKCSEWWIESWPLIQQLTEGEITPPQLENSLLESLRGHCSNNSILDRYEIAGVFARWWREIHWDLHTLRVGGPAALLESWCQSYIASINSDENKDLPLTDVEVSVRNALLPTYETNLSEAENIVETTNSEIQTLDYGEDWDSMSSEDRKLETKQSKARSTQKAVLKKERSSLKKFNDAMSRGPRVKKGTSIAKLRAEGNEAKAVENEEKVAKNTERIAEINADMEIIEAWQNHYNSLTESRKEAKASVKEMKSPEWIQEQMKERLESLDAQIRLQFVEQILGDLFQSQVSEEIRLRMENVIMFLESCWDRYRENIRQIEEEDNQSKLNLDSYLEVLGYDS